MPVSKSGLQIERPNHLNGQNASSRDFCTTSKFFVKVNSMFIALKLQVNRFESAVKPMYSLRT